MPDEERLTVGVLTVDDQAVFRQVAREVIEATPGFESLGEAASGEEALVLADEVDPDLVLIDMRMPGMSGIETASRIVAAHPTVTIVLVSADDPADFPAELERCGAVALLWKKKFGTTALTRLWRRHGCRNSRPPEPIRTVSSDPDDAGAAGGCERPLRDPLHSAWMDDNP